MCFKKQRNTAFIFACLPDSLQYFGQSIRLIASSCGQRHAHTVSFKFGIFIKTSGADLRTAADYFLDYLIILADLFAKQACTQIQQLRFLQNL